MMRRIVKGFCQDNLLSRGRRRAETWVMNDFGGLLMHGASARRVMRTMVLLGLGDDLFGRRRICQSLRRSSIELSDELSMRFGNVRAAANDLPHSSQRGTPICGDD